MVPVTSVAVLVITDGRERYLAETIRSAQTHLRGPVTEWWMYDDTGDTEVRSRLRSRYDWFSHFNAGPRQGFGGAIRAAWSKLAAESTATHVFHVEQDFRFLRDVDLGDMASVLDDHPQLAQLALRRQPWNEAELAAGGVVELHPDAYADYWDDQDRAWLEHRLFWTTNPSLFRISMCSLPWPMGDQSEGRFTHRVLAAGTPEAPAELVRFGCWGDRASGVWVEHLGHERKGHGY